LTRDAFRGRGNDVFAQFRRLFQIESNSSNEMAGFNAYNYT